MDSETNQKPKEKKSTQSCFILNSNFHFVPIQTILGFTTGGADVPKQSSTVFSLSGSQISTNHDDFTCRLVQM